MIEYVKGDCFFTKINDVSKQYQYLTKDIETEVAVIGGGVTGAIVSYYLSKNSIPNIIVEKGRIAHGSTSITTSLLQYELDSNCAELTKYMTEQNVIKSYNLGLKALNEIKVFVDSFGNTFDYKAVDSVLFSNKKLDEKSITQEFLTRQNYGLPVEMFDELSNPFTFDAKFGIIAKNAAAKIDPYKFTHALLNVSTEKYAQVFENTEVVRIEYFENDIILTTVYGYKIKTKKIIIATGYDINLFTKLNLGAKMSTTFNIATTPINDLNVMLDNYVFRDNDNIYHYFRTTKDKRILFGGEDINFLNDINNEDLCEKQYTKLEQMLKQMFRNYNFDVEYKYCGAFATTPDNLGFIGKDPQHTNQWYCLGYGANGILFAVLAGIMLSDLYAGKEDDDLKLFNITRFM